LRVGIWDHEREFQPIRINLNCSFGADAVIASTGRLPDHQPIVAWITDEWPKTPHTPLLETRLCELMQFVFRFDPRIECIDVAMSKPEAFSEADGVGVRMTIARRDYVEWFGGHSGVPVM
jgi:dihydroneopterin aldolase